MKFEAAPHRLILWRIDMGYSSMACTNAVQPWVVGVLISVIFIVVALPRRMGFLAGRRPAFMYVSLLFIYMRTASTWFIEVPCIGWLQDRISEIGRWFWQAVRKDLRSRMKWALLRWFSHWWNSPGS